MLVDANGRNNYNIRACALSQPINFSYYHHFSIICTCKFNCILKHSALASVRLCRFSLPMCVLSPCLLLWYNVYFTFVLNSLCRLSLEFSLQGLAIFNFFSLPFPYLQFGCISVRILCCSLCLCCVLVGILFDLP